MRISIKKHYIAKLTIILFLLISALFFIQIIDLWDFRIFLFLHIW